MGAEARCQLRVDGAAHEGNALLETDELLFRGDARGAERGFRLAIPLASIRNVTATDGSLCVTFDKGDATFVLGNHAEKWAQRIRSPKSRIDKLDVKAEQLVSVIALDDAEFVAELTARAERVVVGELAPKSDLVFLGAEKPADLARLKKAATMIARDGAIWVVHRKGPSGLRDIEIFAQAKLLGLTYTKVARFSPSHTAEKLVIPKAKR